MAEYDCKKLMSMLAELHDLQRQFDDIVDKAHVDRDDSARTRLDHLEQISMKMISDLEYEIRDRSEDGLFKKIGEYTPDERVNLRYLIAQNLVGMDSDRAWEIRKDILSERENPSYSVLLSLAGIDSERAWDIRTNAYKSDSLRKSFLCSLIGLDSERAWKVREDIAFAKEVSFEDGVSVLVSLAGLDSDRAWKIRKELSFGGKIIDGNVVASIIGCDSERAWKMREVFWNNDRDEITKSLTGLDSDRAWEMREKLLRTGVSVYEVAKSMGGIFSAKTEEIRADLLKHNYDEGVILESLNGNFMTSPLIICKNKI